MHAGVLCENNIDECDDPCRSENIECPAGMMCTIVCDGYSSCRDSTVACTDGQGCLLQCSGGENSCFNTAFTCSGDCGLECMPYSQTSTTFATETSDYVDRVCDNMQVSFTLLGGDSASITCDEINTGDRTFCSEYSPSDSDCGVKSMCREVEVLCVGDGCSDFVCDDCDEVTVVDSCEPNPCLNGGVCVDASASDETLSCSCADGFIGALCEINVDECSNDV